MSTSLNVPHILHSHIILQVNNSEHLRCTLQRNLTFRLILHSLNWLYNHRHPGHSKQAVLKPFFDPVSHYCVL